MLKTHQVLGLGVPTDGLASVEFGLVGLRVEEAPGRHRLIVGHHRRRVGIDVNSLKFEMSVVIRLHQRHILPVASIVKPADFLLKE